MLLLEMLFSKLVVAQRIRQAAEHSLSLGLPRRRTTRRSEAFTYPVWHRRACDYAQAVGRAVPDELSDWRMHTLAHTAMCSSRRPPACVVLASKMRRWRGSGSLALQMFIIPAHQFGEVFSCFYMIERRPKNTDAVARPTKWCGRYIDEGGDWRLWWPARETRSNPPGLDLTWPWHRPARAFAAACHAGLSPAAVYWLPGFTVALLNARQPAH